MATYYISTTGNDTTGNGTIGTPWRTLYKATSTVSGNGDIIHVNAGTYIETQQSNLAVGVSIEGDGVTSIIKSTLNTFNYALIRAASVVGTNGNQHVSNLKFDGQLTTTWGFDIEGRSNFSIHDCTIVDFFDRGVIWAGGEGFADGAPSIYATGNSFYNNIMHNCADYNGYGRGCLNFGGQDGMLVYNNTITQTQRAQGHNGWPIKAASGGFIKGCKIYNNTLTKIPMGGDAGDGGWDFCIELFNVLGGVEIYNNTIQGSVDTNYQSKGVGYTYSISIHDNTLMQPTLSVWRENGLIFEFTTPDALVYNNHFKNITYGVVFNTRTLDTVTNFKAYNNLFENIGQNLGASGNAGAVFATYSEGTDDYTVNNFQIYNNTAIAAVGNAPGNAIRFNGAASVTNTKINNNIFQGFYEAWLIGYPSNVISTLDIRNNCLYLNSNANNPFWYIGTPTGINATGIIKANPNLDAGFHPTGTPLVDAGINVGIAYNGSAPDIGFFETGGAATTTVTSFSPTTTGTGITVTITGTNFTGATAVSFGGTAAASFNVVNSTTITAVVAGGSTGSVSVTTASNTGSLGGFTYSNANIPPTANAGLDQSITLPTNSVSLSGSGNDPDGSITTYSWTKISGPNTPTITTPSSANTTVTGLITGVYVFRLLVTDNGGATGFDLIQITVNAANLTKISVTDLLPGLLPPGITTSTIQSNVSDLSIANTEFVHNVAASKQDAIQLTTVGTSGVSTLNGSILNIPQYTSANTPQTPWLSNINASGYKISGLKQIEVLIPGVASTYSIWDATSLGSGEITLSNSNLTATKVVGAGNKQVRNDIVITSGKHFCEMSVGTTTAVTAIGISLSTNDNFQIPGQEPNDYSYWNNGFLCNNGTLSGSPASWTSGDVIGLAFNADTRTLEFFKNGVSQGSFTGIPAGTYNIVWGGQDNAPASVVTANFGATAFAYTVPAGFNAGVYLGGIVPINVMSTDISGNVTLNNAKITSLSGSGTQMVVTDNVGVLSKQAIPSSTFVSGETPAGTMNSSNATFTLASTPITGSVHLYLRGLRLKLGVGYTISGLTITMLIIPDNGDELIADYKI